LQIFKGDTANPSNNHENDDFRKRGDLPTAIAQYPGSDFGLSVSVLSLVLSDGLAATLGFAVFPILADVAVQAP